MEEKLVGEAGLNKPTNRMDGTLVHKGTRWLLGTGSYFSVFSVSGGGAD